MLVSIIVPAYRQEKTIEKDVKNIYETMCQTRWYFEIVVVVDGFVDNTFKEAKKIKHPEISVIGYHKNHGKGYAVKYGMARALGDLVCFIDSGMDINPNGISMVLEHMIWYNADIVVGSKKHPVSKVRFHPIRRFYSWGYHLLTRMLFGVKVRDTQTGLKVYKREVLEKVLPRLLVKEFAFDIELLAVARRLGFTRIYEAPVEAEIGFSEGSKISKDLFLFFNPNIRKVLIDTLAVFYRLHILRYYDDRNKQKWIYDEDLEMKINTGEFK